MWCIVANSILKTGAGQLFEMKSVFVYLSRSVASGR